MADHPHSGRPHGESNHGDSTAGRDLAACAACMEWFDLANPNYIISWEVLAKTPDGTTQWVSAAYCHDQCYNAARWRR